MSQWPQITLFQPNNSSIILLLIFREKENSKIVLALEMSEIKTDVHILIANISDADYGMMKPKCNAMNALVKN